METLQYFYDDLKENLHLKYLDIDDIHEIVNSIMYFEDCDIVGDPENLIANVNFLLNRDYLDYATLLHMEKDGEEINLSGAALYCLICMIYLGPDYTNQGIMEVLALGENYYYLGFKDTLLKTLKKHPEYFVDKNSSDIDTPDKITNLDFKIVTGD